MVERDGVNLFSVFKPKKWKQKWFIAGDGLLDVAVDYLLNQSEFKRVK